MAESIEKDIPWSRIFVEGVAIIVSILLAFAIDAWWADRQERREETHALDVLISDLDLTIEQLTEFQSHAENIVDASLSAYKALADDVIATDRESVSDLVIKSRFRRTMKLPRAAYTNLLSTGDIRFIRDRRLRDSIIQFYQMVERNELIIEKNSTLSTDVNLSQVLVRNGLFLPLPDEVALNDIIVDRNAKIRSVLGDDFQHPPHPFWALPSDSREWDRVRSVLLQSGSDLAVNAVLTARLIDSATELKRKIRFYLEAAGN